jgi:hypothetical protein
MSKKKEKAWRIGRKEYWLQEKGIRGRKLNEGGDNLAANKKYAPAQEYEKKLERVMERLNIKQFDWNWDRHGGWVKFSYKGTWYIFKYTIEKAKEVGVNLQFGSDAFAVVVLTLEDLARAAEKKIYDFGLVLRKEQIDSNGRQHIYFLPD